MNMSKQWLAPLAAASVFVLAPAAEAARPYAPGMQCQALKNLVRARGAVVISTGGNTYDRFVSDGRFCERTQITEAAWAPSADLEDCFVGYTCEEYSRDQW